MRQQLPLGNRSSGVEPSRSLCATAAVFLCLASSPVIAPAQEPSVVFNAAEAGSFPSGWKAREDEGRAVYVVRADGARVFLHAESRKDGHQIGYEVSVDPRRTPWLRFAWRAIALPPGGSELRRVTNDSALGVYVVFAGWGIPPRTLKYVWSTSLPAGTTTESPFTSRVKVLVLRSGMDRIGEWVDEEVNVREDFRRLFREEDVPKIKGLGLLTDSDNTGTGAAGEYHSFTFSASRSPP